MDFETIVSKENIEISEKKSIYQKHIPCGFAMVIVDKDEEVIFSKVYRGENCVKIFIETLFFATDNLFLFLNKNAPLKTLNYSEKMDYESNDICHICEKIIGEFEIKCRDHDHTTGLYRGVAHLICNINFQTPKQIPVIIHNLKNFDSNLILKELNQEYFKKCRVIPKSTEKFLSFSLNKIKFLDSFQFMSASLDNLVSNLRNSGLKAFKITTSLFEEKYGKIDEKDLEILLNKSTYPYEYIDCFEKFEERELPNYEDFYSALNYSNVEKKKFFEAKYIWNKFNCKNIGDFHDLYVLLDTSLLADVFNVFRKKTMNIYGLDPCHYYSIPSLSWNAMLKFTEIEIELLTDIDMYLFIEQNIRCGISQTSKRLSMANNIDMFEKFNPNLESKYILYFDGSNIFIYKI